MIGRGTSARLALFAWAATAAIPAAAQIVTPPNVPPLVEPGQVNLFFDYFLADNLGQPRDNIRGVAQGDPTGFFLWTVAGGSVDLVGGSQLVPPVFGAPPIEPNGRFVDLGGSTSDPGLFQTNRDFAVDALATYRLRFQYRSTGGDAESASVYVGNRRFDVATSSTDFLLFDQTFRFTDLDLLDLAGLVRIGFQGSETNVDNSGIGIDSVLFDQLLPAVPPAAESAVPEPATWATMLLGFGAIGWAARRRPRRVQVHFG